jgi:hypothetical protein
VTLPGAVTLRQKHTGVCDMADIALAVFWFLSLPVFFLIAVGKGGMIVSYIKWTVTSIFKLIFWLILGYLVVVGVTKIFNSDVKFLNSKAGSCDKGGVYSKQFNCEYIYNKATYDVYYWRYLNSDKSDRKVGTVVGLSSCRDTAIYAHRDANGKMKQNLEWSDRMYVCMLIKDGRNLEKHRY